MSISGQLRTVFEQLDGGVLLPEGCTCSDQALGSLACPIDRHRIRYLQKTMLPEEELMNSTPETINAAAMDSRLQAAIADEFGGDMPHVPHLPLEQLRPSPTNPRKTFDQAGIEGLAKSIQTNGLISPIVVRFHPDIYVYEIVAGERRYRALKLLGWNSVPCIVRELSDQQVVEMQIVENLQREDVHEMDEARGYAVLLAMPTEPGRCRVCGCVEERACETEDGPCAWADPSQTLCSNPECLESAKKSPVEVLAARLGKSVSYVYQRLKLADLISEAEQEFRSGRMKASHAIDCARLEPADQKQYVEHGRRGDEFLSVRQMRVWIDQHVRTDLSAAPFSLTDTSLHLDAGPCIGCPKMTATNPALLADLAADVDGEPKKKRGKGDRPAAICLDPACYQAKVQTFVSIKALELENDGGPVAQVWYGDWNRPEKGPLSKLPTDREYQEVQTANNCPHTELAIVAGAVGEAYRAKIGQTIYICRDAKCKKHHAGGGCGNSYTTRRSATEIAKDRKERIALECERAARAECLRQVLAAAVQQKKIPIDDLRVMAGAAIDRLGHDVEVALGKAMQVEPAKDSKSPHSPASYGYAIKRTFPELSRGKLNQLLLCCALAGDMCVSNWGDQKQTKYLAHVANRYGVELGEIRANLTAAAEAKEAAKQAKTKATKGGR